MIRRGWTALIVTAMGLGLFAAHSGVHVHAANAPRITNISVAVDGSGHVSYGMCVVAAAPPSSGTVIVEGPITSTAQAGASFTYNDLSCGDYNGSAYFMHATFSLPLAAGSYTFDAAAVDEPDGSGAGATAPISTAPPANAPTAPPTAAPTHSSGPALRVTVLEPLVRPGATQHFAVSYVADALVQASVAFPGVRPFSLRGRTDIHG